ncbi:MAG: hypothetical protein OEY11_10695 [Gammaproteobacteria bacterium]|nr:hypothetical protein [Gammaproteobacteria bacterium]
MTKVQLGISGVVIFVTGIFLGAKIIDANKSIYAEVKFGDAGGFTVGKQLDLTQPSAFDASDKALLISGIKSLASTDVISQAIIDLEKTGQAMFLPREFNIKLHITNQPDLDKGIAAFCETKGNDFYRKTISIFDNRKESITKSMIRVGAWKSYGSAYCLENDVDHVWVSPETAKNLFPSEAERIVVGTELDLLGRVSNTCTSPI